MRRDMVWTGAVFGLCGGDHLSFRSAFHLVLGRPRQQQSTNDTLYARVLFSCRSSRAHQPVRGPLALDDDAIAALPVPAS